MINGSTVAKHFCFDMSDLVILTLISVPLQMAKLSKSLVHSLLCFSGNRYFIMKSDISRVFKRANTKYSTTSFVGGILKKQTQ